MMISSEAEGNLVAVLDVGAKRFFHQNVMGLGMGENVQKDLCVRHVGGSYDDYVTQSTVQQRAMVRENLRTSWRGRNKRQC